MSDVLQGQLCLPRKLKSRIVPRMAFIAEGLTAGLKPPNSELSRKRRTRRGRKQYPRKSNFDVRIFAFALPVFAVDDFGLCRMHLQVALRQPSMKLSLESFCFLLSSTVHQPIVCISTPWEVRMCHRHPDIKRVVQGKIGQNRT